MATYSILTQTGVGITSGTFFQPGATFRASSAIAFSLDNPSGTIVSITGTGFTFDGANLPTGGTVSGITLFASNAITQHVTIIGLSLALTDLYAAWLGPTTSNVLGLVLNGADTIIGSVFDDSLLGFTGTDTLTGGDGNDILDPGRGADTVDGGAGFDLLSYSSANTDVEITKGVTFDLTQATITDPWGFSDTIISIERARGTRFADIFIGNDADNRFEGLDGADTYTGGAGNDRVSFQRDAQFGGTKGATINLAAGTATDGFGNAETFSGIEQATGTGEADTLIGGDITTGVASYDVFALGDNDIITAGKHVFYVEPGAGNDTITAGPAFDQISYSEYTGPNGATFDLTKGTIADPYGGTDTLIGDFEAARGTLNADSFTGNALNNQFTGMAGNDTFDGGAGQDRVRYDRDASAGGAAGVTVNLALATATDGFGNTDTLISIEAAQGTAQADTLTGGDTAIPGQAYELYGGAGNDTITAGAFDLYTEPGAGNDTITAGAGFDQVSYTDYTGDSGATINLDTGIVADPYGGTDTLVGSFEAARGTRNADSITGNAVNNQFRGLRGDDTINGGAGQDRVRYDRDASSGGGAGVTVNLALGTATDGFGNTDTLVSIEQVEGTALADTLTGGDTNLGLGVSWELLGRAGNDTLTGGPFSTYFEPGAGNDTITGGSGGADQLSYSDFTNGVGVTLDLTKGTVTDPLGGTDTFSGIEFARGTSVADVLTGDDKNNQFVGLNGNDTINGGAGIDVVRYDRDANSGGKAGVTVNLATGTATDGFGATDSLSDIENIRATNATDMLTGDAADNLFQGLDGADTIAGGGGIDTVDYSRDTVEGGKAGATVNLGTGTAIDGFGATDTLSGIENVVGTAQADIITGDAADNALTGGAGDDTIDGAGGSDTAVFSGASASYTVASGAGATLIVTGTDGKDTLSNIEFLAFSDTTISLATTYMAAATTASLAEGTGAGPTPFQFTVTRGGDTSGAAVIVWAATGSGANAASSADFSASVLPSGTVSFAAGETSQKITIDVAADSGVEPDEGFTVTLSRLGASLGTATATILNDDTAGADDNVATSTVADETFHLGVGTDTVVFSQAREAYRIGINGEWTSISGPDGNDYLKDVELLQFGASAPITVDSLRGQPGTRELMSFLSSGQLTFALPLDYTGPLNLKYIYPGTNNDDVVAGTPFNDFMNLAGGNDAAQMGAGDDIIDGGGGNNFLTGGAGRDTFFLDGRFLVPVWSCITDWEVGEALTLWGWTAGVSKAAWSDSAGLPGYLGATMFADIDGNDLVETAITWTGKARADLPATKEIQVSGINVLLFE